MLSISYRNAAKDDLSAIADVFIAAFPESVYHYTGHKVESSVIADIFAICLDSESDAFFVAVADNRIAGYIFAPSRFSHLQYVAVMHGHILRLFWRWITGQYKIGMRPVFVAIRNWISLLGETWNNKDNVDARILSVAVAPELQGYKIGTNLMKLALEHLKSLNVDCVRLEVRPDNSPARHVYEKYGFKTTGHTRDTQGDWLIMVKNLHDDSTS